MTKGLCECGCGRKTEISKDTDWRKGAVRGQPRRFVVGHSRRSCGTDYVVDPTTGCWVWQLAKQPNGYGRLKRGRNMLAHRLYYEQFKGEIPSGLEIDHLCGNRACVNPDHLEAVTRDENIQRGKAARLDRAAVSEMRRMAADGVSAASLSKQYGVTTAHVYRILTGQAWK